MKRYITTIPKRIETLFLSSEDYFKINQKENGGESGNFFEYFFGFFEDELILDLIYLIEDIGKLIDNVKYFTCESLEILKKYITYKYIMCKRNINFVEKENRGIEDDVKEMEKYIDLKEIKSFQQTNKMEGKVFNEIRKEQHKKIFFVELNKEERKNYDYYVKKISEAKSQNESRRYTRELFDHLKII